MSITDMANKLNTTEMSVYKKCLKLNLNVGKAFNNTEWTDKQIDFLIDNYTNLSNSFFCSKLNKTPKQIGRKIKELNLAGERKPNDTFYYEKEEIEYIKNNWEKMNDIELANNLNLLFKPIRRRTAKTVAGYRRQVLSLRRPIWSNLNNVGKNLITWTDEEIAFLRDNFYSLSIYEIASHLNKTESSIKNKANSLGLRTFGVQGIKLSKERLAFMKNNFDKLPINQLSIKLQVPAEKVLAKAIRLKLVYKIEQSLTGSDKIDTIDWTAKKITFLKDNFDKLPINQLVTKLQIPIKRILSKAVELNLVYKVKQLTNPELFVKNQLEKLNVDFEYQKNIHCKKGTPYRIDFISGDKIIEIQGDYYHCNPTVYKNGPINSVQKNNIVRDEAKKANLINAGYKVYYLWEKEIKDNKEKVISFLAALFSDK